MAILIDETRRVLVQGITGREGQARTRLMRVRRFYRRSGRSHPGDGAMNTRGALHTTMAHLYRVHSIPR